MATKANKVLTGIDGLDQVLFGGLLEGDVFVLGGAPGTGKTNLGLQFLHQGASRYDEPGMLITFEEFPERIYRDAASFGWDLRKLEKENKLKVVFTSPHLLQQDLLNEGGVFAEMIYEIGARRIVVDSITHFELLSGQHNTRREALYGLMNALKREGLTSLLLRELPQGQEMGSAPEDFLADGLIALTQERVEGERMRYLEVLKSRGTAHVQARSLMVFTETGLQIIPASRPAFFRFEEAASTGLAKLDKMLGGGIPYGAHYLLEVYHSFHDQVFEANLLKETLESGDIWVHIGALSALPREIRALLVGLGGTANLLDSAVKQGRLKFFGPVNLQGGAPASLTVGEVLKQVEELYQTVRHDQKVRLVIDVSTLLINLGAEPAIGLLSHLQQLTDCYGGVALSLLNPKLAAEDTLSKIHRLSAGIMRVWKEGDFEYLQVVKTVNSVRTRIVPVLEIPDPPYLQILC
jgi:circadian clock protein KaiC